MKSVVFLSALLLLTATCLVHAGGGKKSSRPEGTRGIVTGVDQGAKTFTFRTGKKKDPNAQEITVAFDSATKFVKLTPMGKTDAKSEDLSGAKGIAVVYETKDGKSLASKVTIIAMPKKKK